jgi:hypothetical protein
MSTHWKPRLRDFADLSENYHNRGNFPIGLPQAGEEVWPQWTALRLLDSSRRRMFSGRATRFSNDRKKVEGTSLPQQISKDWEKGRRLPRPDAHENLWCPPANRSI